MLCPASCLPLLRELAQWRCLLGWHRQHSVTSTSAAGLSTNAGQQQGSEVKGGASRPVGRTKPLPGSQVSPGPSGALSSTWEKYGGEQFLVVVPFLTRRGRVMDIGSCSDRNVCCSVNDVRC